MLKTFYVQTEKDTGRITDVIEYAHDGYCEVQLETPLPPKIMAGCYKLLAGSALYVPDWDVDQKIEIMRNDLSNAVMELSMLIAMGGM